MNTEQSSQNSTEASNDGNTVLAEVPDNLPFGGDK